MDVGDDAVWCAQLAGCFSPSFDGAGLGMVFPEPCFLLAYILVKESTIVCQDGNNNSFIVTYFFS